MGDGTKRCMQPMPLRCRQQHRASAGGPQQATAEEAAARVLTTISVGERPPPWKQRNVVPPTPYCCGGLSSIKLVRTQGRRRLLVGLAERQKASSLPLRAPPPPLSSPPPSRAVGPAAEQLRAIITRGKAEASGLQLALLAHESANSYARTLSASLSSLSNRSRRPARAP